MDEFDVIVSGIYDCAANPELWPQTLEQIRSTVGCAYVMTAFGDFSAIQNGGHPMHKVKHTAWDTDRFKQLERHLTTIPCVDSLYRNGIDAPWVQMELIEETEFQKSDFYQDWVRPQRLRDCLNILYLDRQLLRGVLSFATAEGTPLLGEREKKIAGWLAPHIRRAISINDMVDKGNLALALYRAVLDTLSVAVLVVTDGGRLVFCNSLGDALLSKGELLLVSHGNIKALRPDVTGSSLDTAIAKAIKGDRSLGISGIGVPLAGMDGEWASAYILPLKGDDLRGQIAPGHAAIFVAQRSEQQPMAVEILRTVFDLTPTEARVAYATSLGETPEAIAITHGTAVDTIRFHLKNTYLKAGVNNKTALAACVAALIPPVSIN